ncbi:MAG: bifunctional methylenetetrahydrofolate dehydrogenase/methenyltetrahydrofolate cyclohydrolase FolD [Nanoarchaeota archaeon]
MEGMILDGKAVAEKVRYHLKAQIGDMLIKPGLAVVQVGDDPASEVYITGKLKACNEVGIHSEHIHLPHKTEAKELLSRLQKLNEDSHVHGILVQLPLPGHLDPLVIQEAIDPAKDVDGMHPVNVGLLSMGRPGLVPCTPKGIMMLLDDYKVELTGKHAVIVGRSNIVGKPMAQLLLARNMTVTMCHSRTKDLGKVCATADVLVSAVGKAGIITGSFIKDGAVVIDVGINRVDGKLQGDVMFDVAEKIAKLITPVPGGVGPMTIAMLLQNTYEAAKRLT